MRAEEAARALSAPPAPADPGSPCKRKIRALRLRAVAKSPRRGAFRTCSGHGYAVARPQRCRSTTSSSACASDSTSDPECPNSKRDLRRGAELTESHAARHLWRQIGFWL
jgi:hypothetical protein